MIPSENSEEITFLEITETPAFNDFESKYDCPFIKRKKINILRTVSRNRLDPNLYKLMFSHHTITEGNQYAEYIDKMLNAFFIKNDEAHLVLEVQTTEDVKARSLFEMGSLSLDIFDEFCKEEDLDFDSEDFDVKLAVQSPGFIELSGLEMGGIIVLGIVIVAIAGGGFDFKNGKGIVAGIKTDGIIEKIIKFLKVNSNIKTKRKLLEKHMEKLEIKDPKELIEILKQLDK